MKKHLLLAATLSLGWTVSAAPLPPDQLQLRAVFDFGTDVGYANSMFNPVYGDNLVFVNQVNAGYQGFGIYPSGWNTPVLTLNNVGVEHRMVTPFPGAFSSTYLLGSSSGAAPSTTTFSRYNFDGTDPVTLPAPSGLIVEGFDWVEDNTVVYTSYTSGTRNQLFLANVTAEPFNVTADTRWNAQGSITTSVSTRIRNVRGGDVYKGYAYYGDAGQNSNPNFYALNINTGVETLLGNAGALTGTGSYGIWTVLERGGYLYVQTTDNGIQVYNMTSATELGSLETTYSKEQLDAVTGQLPTAQYYGLDVAPDGSRFILGGPVGKVYEFGAPDLRILNNAASAVLAWPSSVTAVAVQSSANLATAPFADMDPQPSIIVDGRTNTVDIPLNADASFFRLRKNP